MKTTKHFFYSLSISFILIGCSSSNKEDILKNEIEDIIKEKMDNPNTYEFSGFSLDSIQYSTSRKILEETELNLKKETNILRKKKLEKEISVQKLLFPKYKFQGFFEFRTENKFGAKILAKCDVVADDEYKLMYLKDNIGDTIYKDTEIIIEESKKILNSEK